MPALLEETALPGPSVQGEARGMPAPAALLVGVETGGPSSLVTWPSRDQEPPRAEVLLVASVWVPAPSYSAGVRRKKETSRAPQVCRSRSSIGEARSNCLARWAAGSRRGPGRRAPQPCGEHRPEEATGGGLPGPESSQSPGSQERPRRTALTVSH